MQDESTGADGPADLSKCQNLPAPACPESIGRQLLLASPMSGEICLAEVRETLYSVETAVCLHRLPSGNAF